MVGDIALRTLSSALLSAVAGLVVAVTTALLADHRERRRWLRTKVYGPLYGELTRVISGDLPEGQNGYVSLWAGFDYYKTYRVDADLAEALDRYASDLSELSGLEGEEEFTAFVDALPEYVCSDGDAVADLSSGRTVDMQTWLKRNLLVLSTAPAYRAEAFGFEPVDLGYLWAEVDGITEADVRSEPFDTAAALEVVSEEFNWGYEALYGQFDSGWVDDLASALLTTADHGETNVQKALLLRRELGETASTIKSMIEVRADRGLLGSLWRG